MGMTGLIGRGRLAWCVLATMAIVSLAPNAVAQTSRTAALTPQVIDAILQNYYQAPLAEHVPAIIDAAMAHGLAEDRSKRLVLIAFIAGLIASDDGFVERLAPVFRKRPGDEPMRLVRAVLYSGRADSQILIDRLKLLWPERAAEITALAAKGAKAVYALSFQDQPVVLDMNWAFFGATGRPEPVMAIIGSLSDLRGTTDPARLAIAHGARWSLAVQARQHERVMDLCRKALWGSHAEDLRGVIKAAEANDIGVLKAEADEALKRLATEAAGQALPTAATARREPVKANR